MNEIMVVIDLKLYMLFKKKNKIYTESNSIEKKAIDKHTR